VAGDNSDNSYHVVTGSGVDAGAVLDGFTIRGGNADGVVYPQYGGGGIYSADSSPTLTNVTFSGNTASNRGGGMFNWAGNPTLHNCILWGDSAPDSPEIDNDSSTPTISYSLVEGSGGSDHWDANLGADAGDNIDADPLFVDAAGGDLHLGLDSPAVDAGNNDYVSVMMDLDGNPRIVNGRVDMGAYEYLPRVYLPLVTRNLP
jgi:hypothetical protein